MRVNHETLIHYLRAAVEHRLHAIIPAGRPYSVKFVRGSYDLIVDLGDPDLSACRVKGFEFEAWLAKRQPGYDTLRAAIREKQERVKNSTKNKRHESCNHQAVPGQSPGDRREGHLRPAEKRRRHV